MPRKKEDTPSRIVRRTYEERHKEERKLKTRMWGTSLEREYGNEIDLFLKQQGLTKVELIVAGYKALQSKYGPNKIE